MLLQIVKRPFTDKILFNKIFEIAKRVSDAFNLTPKDGDIRGTEPSQEV